MESAERFNLVKIRLNLYLPQLHEDFFATWQHSSRARGDHKWSADVPLTVDDRVVGILSVTGLQDEGSVSGVMAGFVQLIEPLEVQLAEVLRVHTAASAKKADGDAADSASEAVAASADAGEHISSS